MTNHEAIQNADFEAAVFEVCARNMDSSPVCVDYLHFPFMHDDEASFSKLKGLSLAISTAVLSQEIKAITLHLILSGSPMNFCFSCTRCLTFQVY